MRENEGNHEGGVAVGQKVSCVVRQVRQQRPRHVATQLLGPDGCILLAENTPAKQHHQQAKITAWLRTRRWNIGMSLFVFLQKDTSPWTVRTTVLLAKIGLQTFFSNSFSRHFTAIFLIDYVMPCRDVCDCTLWEKNNLAPTWSARFTGLIFSVIVLDIFQTCATSIRWQKVVRRNRSDNYGKQSDMQPAMPSELYY